MIGLNLPIRCKSAMLSKTFLLRKKISEIKPNHAVGLCIPDGAVERVDGDRVQLRALRGPRPSLRTPTQHHPFPTTRHRYGTVWCNQMGIVFAEMSSRAALTGYTVLKTAFKNINMKTISFGIFIIKILYFVSARRMCIFKEIQQITTRNSQNWVWVLL